MHPFIVEQLAAGHVKGLLAAVDEMRRARQGRPARRSRKIQATNGVQLERHAGRTRTAPGHPPALPVIIDPGGPHS